MRVLISTAPEEEAPRIAELMLTERLIACANILNRTTSMYWWEGEIQRDTEALMVMETTAQLCGAAMKRLAEAHSYDVPKIIALDPSGVNEDYRAWLAEVLVRT